MSRRGAHWRSLTWGVLLALGAALAGCGADPREEPPRSSGTRAVQGTAGRILGTCRLVGTPHPARLREWPGMGIEEDQDDESVVTGNERALAGCVVTLEVDPSAQAPSTAPTVASSVTLTAETGRFAPHVAIARAPVQLVLRSLTDEDLSVHGYGPSSRETVFNVSLAPRVVLDDVAGCFLTRPGVYRIVDDARSHFTAWLHVVATEHADVTSTHARDGVAAGGYRLESVPPGRHVLHCWHEPMDRRERSGPDGSFHGYALGPPIEMQRRVLVVPGGELRVDFDVPGEADAPDAK